MQIIYDLFDADPLIRQNLPSLLSWIELVFEKIPLRAQKNCFQTCLTVTFHNHIYQYSTSNYWEWSLLSMICLNTSLVPVRILLKYTQIIYSYLIIWIVYRRIIINTNLLNSLIDLMIWNSWVERFVNPTWLGVRPHSAHPIHSPQLDFGVSHLLPSSDSSLVQRTLLVLRPRNPPLHSTLPLSPQMSYSIPVRLS